MLLLLIKSKNNIMSILSGNVSIFCIVILSLIILFTPVIAESEQPKPINGPLILMISSSEQIPFAEQGEEDLSPFSLMIKLYKRYLSPANSSRCPMYPSCSSFAAQALKYHGETGLVMAFDRLLRCGRDLEDYPLFFERRRVLRFDPVPKMPECKADESPK